jgi:hypothetical protein
MPADNPFQIMLFIFKPVWRYFWQWGWIIGPVFFAPFFWNSWVYFIRIRTMKKFKWQMLEIKFPAEVEKTPLAMEQVLATMHSILFKGGWWKRYIYEGRVQEWFSLEITTFEGELHFYIRTIAQFRDLIEAAIYAQYPQAEIYEAEDYVMNVPNVIPNETHNLFGSEYKLAREDAYPIRTYQDFEFESYEGKANVDPLAVIIESMSKLRQGEQAWIQIVIRPTDDGWKKASVDLISNLVGRQKKTSPGSYIAALLRKEVQDYAKGFIEAPFQKPEYDSFEFGEKKSDKPHSLMQFLTPLEKEILEAVERNVSKVGFETVIRVVYIAKKEVFNIPTFFQVGSGFNQFNTQHMNAIKRDNSTITACKFPFKKVKEMQRKRWLLFKYRIRMRPKKMFILNIEELASIFHPPGRIVMAPTTPRIQTKKGEPPHGLPVY